MSILISKTFGNREKRNIRIVYFNRKMIDPPVKPIRFSVSISQKTFDNGKFYGHTWFFEAIIANRILSIQFNGKTGGYYFNEGQAFLKS